MKRLTAQGYGVDVKEAQAFTEEQEEKLWNLKLLGCHSAQRSGKEHKNLRFEQFTLNEGNEIEPEKFVFNSFGEKNNQGGLKHWSIKTKRIEHYANNVMLGEFI